MESAIITNSLTVLPVDDLDAAVAWYTRLLGREPDRRPVTGLAEWQITEGGGIQVFLDPDRAGTASMTLAVADMDRQAGVLGERDVTLGEVEDTPEGFRVATVVDPAGNAITFAQDLNAAD